MTEEIKQREEIKRNIESVELYINITESADQAEAKLETIKTQLAALKETYDNFILDPKVIYKDIIRQQLQLKEEMLLETRWEGTTLENSQGFNVLNPKIQYLQKCTDTILRTSIMLRDLEAEKKPIEKAFDAL